MALAQATIFELPLTVVPSGSSSTGSFSCPLSAFSSGRVPFVNRPNGLFLPKTAVA
ncbi:MAG TPA: hypothetical protein VIJ51_10100 [Solirubrobacteraceae bacterium]